MPFRNTIRWQPRRVRLVALCCALGWLGLADLTRAMAQGTKPPAMGSAGMTGGMVPSSNSPGGAKPAAPAPGQDPAPAAPVTEQAPVPNPRPVVRENPAPPLSNPHVDNGIPPFHLARLVLNGEVTGDRAIIAAEIDIDVNRNQGDTHDVPLRLTQAHVLSKEYDGPGQEGPVLDSPPEDGIVWRFSGYGTHRLKLKLWVPVRQTPAGQQLVMSLPTMPAGFDAQLNLKIAGSPVVVRASREVSVLSNDRIGTINQISANVRGPRLDLSWSEPPAVQTSFLKATTFVTLHREGDRMIAVAEQSLLPENAGVKEVEIKLPDGFDLDELTGTLVRGHEAILGRSGWRKVSLLETSGKQVDLNWVLSAPFNSMGGTLQFDGLLVPDARSQSGRIRMLDCPGYQMVPRPGQFVRRTPPSSPQTAEAFEFTKQPFRITWDVQRVLPKFSVRPRYLLFVSAGQLVLETRFRFQTDAGSVEQVELEWGNVSAAEGWRLDPASVSSDLVATSEGGQLNQPERLLMAWKTPQTGVFDTTLRFVRSMADGTKTAPIHLPRIVGSRSQPSDVLVAAEDHLEVEIKSLDGISVSTSPTDPRLLDGLPSTLASQIQRSAVLDPEQSRFDLSWKAQARVVEADAEIELRRSPDGRIRVHQTVRFDVRFGRLSSVRFQLPKSLTALIPAGSSGSAMAVTVEGKAVKSQLRDGVLEATLSEPRLGEIVSAVDYSLPGAADSSPVSVPVIASLDTKMSAIRVRIPEGEPLRVATGAEGWQPVPTSPDATVWFATAATQVPVMRDADQTASPRFSIDHAFYRTRFDTMGRIEGVCEFHWTGDVRGVPVTLPPDSELLGVMFNGTALAETPGQITVNAQSPSQYLFRIPSTPESSRLAIWYRSLQSAPFSHRDLRTVLVPQLPPDVSVVRSLWELELPVGRHLFIGPGDLTPEYEWMRSGLFWSRVPIPRYAKEREDATVEARLMTSLSEPGEVYAYSSIGPIQSLRFQSMNRSLILLLGAGITLVMGFLFWTLPILRNMLSLLLIAFGLSLLSLWYLEPIQLMLQPAALGGMLAILASLIDLKSGRPAMNVFPSSMIPAPPPPPPIPASELKEPEVPGRGSSVSRYQSSSSPATALYQPGTSEVGRP